MMKQSIFSALVVAFGSVSWANAADYTNPVGNLDPQENELVHIPPTMEDLEAANIRPELKQVIRRGYDLFMNTQQLRGEFVFNSMNCQSCHMGEGRMPFAGPIWPAATTLPDYRGKNKHVNSLEERIAGCFAFSMNGIPPEYGSDNMLAISSYIQWLAKGSPVYPDQKIYGRGYPKLPDPEQTPDYKRGKQTFMENCSICHGDNGAGLVQNEEVVFPALWGDTSYNWGAGIVRKYTLASFIRHNMPLGQPNSMSVQQSWDLAEFINSQERPQDPRFLGDVASTRTEFESSFHKHTNYGLTVNGVVLGDHENFGEKPIRMPEMLGPRTFGAE
ncbi:c-type cytochrome [Suttonella sp. R2A3]|uniref:c-type cytochrome n=1 Tax=Suttonella sp. R2A3 TaxID=2908648 RepID=UPI001F170AC9|nr:c-type cytochrome [Suttonella sp. R2A3]UJF24876.1 c-type cytochrome [Suttonella sp. R2A3]